MGPHCVFEIPTTILHISSKSKSHHYVKVVPMNWPLKKKKKNAFTLQTFLLINISIQSEPLSHYTQKTCLLLCFAGKSMATHSSTLAWKIPWTEKPGRLQSMGSLRVGHDWKTSLSRIGEGDGNPLQCSCLKNPRDGGAWWAAVYGVAQSRTWLKWLNSSSSSSR